MKDLKIVSVTDSLPKIDEHDNWNKEHKVSERVIVFILGYSPTFGRYYYESGHWVVEGLLGFDQNKVKFFLEIPYWESN